MSAVERAAEVLADHQLGFMGTCVNTRGISDCAWIAKKPVDRRGSFGDQYRAHVAEALAAAGCLRDDREGETVTHTHTHQPSSIPGGCSCGWNHPGVTDGGDPS